MIGRNMSVHHPALAEHAQDVTESQSSTEQSERRKVVQLV